MRKLRKIKLNNALLNEDELKQLKGGGVNDNWLVGCSCTYYDGKRGINKNSYVGCTCTCVY